MFVSQINFQADGETTNKQQEEIDIFLGLLRMDGRILGQELLTVRNEDNFKSFVSVPAKDAFEKLINNQYIKNKIEKLKAAGISQPTLHIIGEEISEADSCECPESSAYILFTQYLMIQSPLRCFDCFCPMPLYRIPHFSGEDFCPVISWQTDYKACDSLQMNSETGARFGIREISKFDSSLSKRGLNICSQIKELTNKNCYYYLFKYYGKSDKIERNRKCPSCNNEWLLTEKFHHLFDFRCDTCHLLSNIAFSS